MAIQKINYEDKANLQIISDIPDRNKTSADDINEIKQVVNNNADELQNTKSDISSLDNEISKIIDILPTEQAEGEYISMQDSSDFKFKKFGVEGNSVQETRSGKNKFNKDEEAMLMTWVTEEKLENGIKLKVTNATAGFAYARYKILENIEANQTVRIKANFANNGANGGYGIGLANSETSTSIAGPNRVSGQVLSYQITAEDVSTYDTLIIFLRADSAEENGYVDYTDIIVTIDNEGMTYEEYGAMPSPQFPSTIQNVTGDVNITVTNKNMANADYIYARMKAHKSVSCLEKTVDGKECISFNNTQYRPDVDPPFDLLGIKYKENTAYTIRGMFKKDGTAEGQTLIIKAVYTDGSSNQVMTTTKDWQELRLVTNANKTVKNIGFSYGNTAMWLLDKSSIFIAEGDTTDYIANEQQEVTFPLLEDQRLMLNDYLADDGVHHTRKQIELDGTENWKIGSINQARYSLGLTVEDLDKQVTCLDKQMLSNWFILNSSNESNTENVDKFTFKNFSGGNTMYFFFPKSYFTATTSAEILAEWKAKLAEAKQAGTPMTLEYKTAQETTEAYTEEQQEAYNQFKNLKTYKNGSNVYSTNEVSPIFKVEYVEDLNAVLTQVNQLILEGGI